MPVAQTLFDHDDHFDLGLYIDLKPDTELSFKAAAEAALAFDALVRDFALTAGLGRDVDLNLVAGESGSLHLKGVLRSLSGRISLVRSRSRYLAS